METLKLSIGHVRHGVLNGDEKATGSTRALPIKESAFARVFPVEANVVPTKAGRRRSTPRSSDRADEASLKSVQTEVLLE